MFMLEGDYPEAPCCVGLQYNPVMEGNYANAPCCVGLCYDPVMEGDYPGAFCLCYDPQCFTPFAEILDKLSNVSILLLVKIPFQSQ